MGIKRFSFGPGQPQRVEVTWRFMWRDTTVKLDGVTLGTIQGSRELKEGWQFILGDGSTLTVRLSQNIMGSELEVLHNNHPLPGSASDPEHRLKSAYGIVFFIGGANIVVGLIVLLFHIEILERLGLGAHSIIFGAYFLMLGYFVTRRSLVALVVAIVLWALDTIVSLVTMGVGLGRPPIGAGVVRLMFLFPMIRAFGPIRSLRQQAAARAAAPAQFPGAPRERGPISEWLVAGAVAGGLVVGLGATIALELTGRAPMAWQEFESQESSFSVLFPDKPEEETDSTGEPDSGFVTRIHSVDLGHSFYMVMCSEDPEMTGEDDDVDETLDLYCEFAVMDVDGQLVERSPISLAGYPGRDVTISFDGGDSVCRSRFYIAGTKEYEVTAMTPQGENFAEHAKRFLDSFKFLEKPSPEPPAE